MRLEVPARPAQVTGITTVNAARGGAVRTATLGKCVVNYEKSRRNISFVKRYYRSRTGKTYLLVTSLREDRCEAACVSLYTPSTEVAMTPKSSVGVTPPLRTFRADLPLTPRVAGP